MVKDILLIAVDLVLIVMSVTTVALFFFLNFLIWSNKLDL